MRRWAVVAGGGQWHDHVHSLASVGGGDYSGILSYGAVWSEVTASGQTLTFSSFQITGSEVIDNSDNLAQITSASLVVTLSPQVVATSGTVTGTMTLVSTLATISGSFTGTYVAQ